MSSDFSCVPGFPVVTWCLPFHKCLAWLPRDYPQPGKLHEVSPALRPMVGSPLTSHGPASWVALCLPDTTTLPNATNLTHHSASAEPCHHYCHHPKGLHWALLPVAGHWDARVALCALESSIYQSMLCFHFTEYMCMKAGLLMPWFFKIQLKWLVPLNPESPSFRSALESIEGWLRIKSKGNKLLHYLTGCIVELILSAWLPVALEWVFSKKSLAPPRGPTPLIPKICPNLFCSA